MGLRLTLSTLLLAGLLAGCNDGETTLSEPVAQQKMGYGEPELYDPIHNPAGTLLPEGATAVLFLEASGGPLLEGDTGGDGYDELWFEWPESTVLWMFMEDQDLGVIARVELWDASGGLHLEVDAERRYGEVELPAGIYGLRLYAAHDEPAPMSAFIRYELGEPSASSQHLSIQANASDLEMAMQYGECVGCDLSRANLSKANLPRANLERANLSEADLSGANMGWANLLTAELNQTDLSGAMLWGASLLMAELYRADLSHANLSHADLSYSQLHLADLSHANLSYAKLHFADLSDANLSGARLNGANLVHANLTGANLTDADLRGARLTIDGITFTCGPASIGECR